MAPNQSLSPMLVKSFRSAAPLYCCASLWKPLGPPAVPVCPHVGTTLLTERVLTQGEGFTGYLLLQWSFPLQSLFGLQILTLDPYWPQSIHFPPFCLPFIAIFQGLDGSLKEALSLLLTTPPSWCSSNKDFNAYVFSLGVPR